MARATSGGGFARFCSLELDLAPRERKKGEKDGPDGSFEGSARGRAASGRDCRRVDALAGDHSGGMGVGFTVMSRRSTVYSFE